MKRKKLDDIIYGLMISILVVTFSGLLVMLSLWARVRFIHNVN